MTAFKRMEELDLAGKRLLIREDFNVPLAAGAISSDLRIRAALPTLRRALEQGARTLVMSHLGRPAEGRIDPDFSLSPVAERLSQLLGRQVPLLPDVESAARSAAPIALLENTRFLKGEKAGDEGLAEQLAALADVFVMDAFAAAHRSHASVCGVALYAPVACAGPLLAGELDALAHALEAPARPLVAIVGGAKVSSKLEVLESLSVLVDRIIVGGGIANTFAAARGLPVGASLHEPELMNAAERIANKTDVLKPVDWMVGKRAAADERALLRPVQEVEDDDLILDIGPETARRCKAALAAAGTIVWNGPVGMFEFDQFGEGTRLLAEGVAGSAAFSIVGGGDTLAAIDKYGVAQEVSYRSTGGGAFLEYMEGKALPGIAALAARADG